LGCSWDTGDVLVVGGLFVEINSYAIASCAMKIVSGVTRWGLFLMREVHSFWRVHSLWKAEMVQRARTSHSISFFRDRYCSSSMLGISEALSKERDPVCSDDDYQIESSTDVRPCKSGATI